MLSILYTTGTLTDYLDAVIAETEADNDHDHDDHESVDSSADEEIQFDQYDDDPESNHESDDSESDESVDSSVRRRRNRILSLF